MKSSFILLVAAIILFFTSCGDNKAATNTKETAQNSSSETTKEASASSSPGDSIVGEWELVGVTEDKNGNEQLDPDERKSAIKMDDYMKLNSDGSAVMFVFKNKGRYEIRKDESSGKEYLDLYDSENGKHPKGYIMSVTKDELLIMNKFGGDSITIWKKV